VKVNLPKLTLLSASVILALNSSPIMAGGFQIFEQDAADLGTAQAGYGAGALDASTEYTNPAGMVLFTKSQITLGVEVISLNVNFAGTVGTGAVTSTGFKPWPNYTATGTATGSAVKAVPNLHLVIPINDRWFYGAGVGVPFGLATNYSPSSIVGSYATTSSIQTINVSQDLAYKIDDQISAGLGVDVQQFQGEFDANLFNELAVTNQVSSYGVGWHAGLLYQFTPHTRIGVAYHSAITQNAQGPGSVAAGELELPILGVITTNATSYTATTTLNMPAWLTAGFYQDITENWSIMATYNYTLWNTTKSLAIDGITLAQEGNGSIVEPITLQMNFNNSSEVSLGTQYKFNTHWTGRFGIGYDQTPTQNIDRELRLPSSDLYNVAAGVHYQANEHWGFDVGYEHAFAAPASVNKVSGELPLIPTVTIAEEMIGNFNNSADIFGAQLTYNF
jgi:long-chain fatty acid transport protein